MTSVEAFSSAQLAAASRTDQRTSCVGLEGAGRKPPPPLLRSRTLPAIVVPGVNILQAQLGNYGQDVLPSHPHSTFKPNLASRFSSARVSFSRDDSLALDVRRKSAISKLCGSGSYGPERGEDGTLVLRVPAPHVVAARAYRMAPQQQTSGSGTPLSRIGKLLTQGGSRNEIVVDDTNVIRRLSWERRDTLNSRMPRSSSIDSMVEAVWSESPSPSEPLITEKRASLRPDRSLALVSPSVGRRMKGQRGVNGEWPKADQN